MNGIWAMAAVGARAARPHATTKAAAATIDGLPVPAIDPSITAPCRRCRSAPDLNYVPIVAFVRCDLPAARQRQKLFRCKPWVEATAPGRKRRYKRRHFSIDKSIFFSYAEKARSCEGVSRDDP